MKYNTLGHLYIGHGGNFSKEKLETVKKLVPILNDASNEVLARSDRTVDRNTGDTNIWGTSDGVGLLPVQVIPPFETREELFGAASEINDLYLQKVGAQGLATLISRDIGLFAVNGTDSFR